MTLDQMETVVRTMLAQQQEQGRQMLEIGKWLARMQEQLEQPQPPRPQHNQSFDRPWRDGPGRNGPAFRRHPRSPDHAAH